MGYGIIYERLLNLSWPGHNISIPAKRAGVAVLVNLCVFICSGRLVSQPWRKGKLMLIVILLGLVGLVGLGFSVFLYKKYKESHKTKFLIFFMILLVFSLNTIDIALKWVSVK